MSNPDISSRLVNLILRASVWACFVGHGMFGVRQKAEWLVFYRAFGFPEGFSLATMPIIGLVDITIGFLALLWPTRLLFIYAASWTIFTGLLRPFVGMSVFEFVERAGNFGPPIALLLGSAGAALLSKVETYNLLDEKHYARMRQVLAATTCLFLLGHGGLALAAKPMLVTHWQSLGLLVTQMDAQTLTRMMGAWEVVLAFLVLLRPTPVICLTVIVWKLFTESLFVVGGAPAWEVLERGGDYGTPLALLVVLTFGAARARDQLARFTTTAPLSGSIESGLKQ
jgi:hypothetical protein